MSKYLYQELTYTIRGVLFNVYNTLGPGFREETYKQALRLELMKQNIPFETEKSIDVYYNQQLIDTYRLDLVIDGKVIVELKATEELHPRFEAQLLSYLKASGMRLGLLVNFGTDKLQIIRRIN